MAKGFYKDVTRALAAAGFEYEKNAKGGHERWVNRETGRLVIVPNPLKSRHTANDILKSADIEKKF